MKPLAGTLAPLPPLEAGDHLDQPAFHARYLAMPEETRAQLISGVVYVRGRVLALHAERHADLVSWLVMYRGHTTGLEAASGGTVIVGPDSELEPDAAMRVAIGGQTRVNANDFSVGCPEFIGEIATESASIELHAKRRDYERYGAEEYVVALLREARLIWLARERVTTSSRCLRTPTESTGLASFPVCGSIHWHG